MRRLFLVFLLIVLWSLQMSPAMGQGDDDAEPAYSDDAPADQDKEKEADKETEEDKPAKSNLPLNFYGRSGMLLTSSTHVLEKWDIEPGIGYLYESSDIPQYTTETWAFNLALGLPAHFMLFAHMPYIQTNLQYGERYNALGVKVRDFSQKSKSGLGSVETGFQWAFFMQDRFLPGMAAGLSILTPTGDYTQKMSEVKDFGFKINIAMSLEIIDLFFTQYVFAILADGSLVFDDPFINERQYEEKHGLVHAGMLFPLHPRNFINLLLEYEGELMKGTTNREDTNGFVGGFRFITNRLGATAGVEYLMKEPEDMDHTFRYMGTASYRFW